MGLDRAAAVERLVAPTLAAMGYEIVRVLFMGQHRPLLQIMVERADRRAMSVDDCAEVSRTVSAVLDVEDPIAGSYTLEVSSPGIDRPLTRPEDFVRFAGFEAKVETRMPLDGRKKFTGRLLGLEGERVRIATAEGEMALPLADVQRAKLVLTDELIADGRCGALMMMHKEVPMDTTIAVPRLELLQVADAVAREKGIERDEVLEAMEQAIQKAGRSKYGHEHDIRAEIDRKTGEIRLMRFREVVETVENEATQITLAQGAANRVRRSRRATSSSTSCRRSISAASPRRPPSRSSCRRCARPSASASSTSSRIARARSSTAWSSASSSATSRSISAAPRRCCAATSCCRARPSATATACAPSSTTCARSRAGRRSSCRAPIRSSWPSCSRRKCRRSTTASSRSRRWPAIPAAAPRSR